MNGLSEEHHRLNPRRRRAPEIDFCNQAMQRALRLHFCLHHRLLDPWADGRPDALLEVGDEAEVSVPRALRLAYRLADHQVPQLGVPANRRLRQCHRMQTQSASSPTSTRSRCTRASGINQKGELSALAHLDGSGIPALKLQAAGRHAAQNREVVTHSHHETRRDHSRYADVA